MRFSDYRPSAIVLAISSVLVLYAQPAAAYLDPGTGSVLIQGLVGALAAVAFTVKLYWHKFKALFRPKGKPDEDDTGKPAEQQAKK